MSDVKIAQLEDVSPETAGGPLQEQADCGNVPDRKGAESTSIGGSMARRRFQEGQVYRQGKSWIGRWRDDVLMPNGEVRRIRRARVIGTIREYPTKPLAKRRLQIVLAAVNDPAYRPGRITNLADFVERWRSEVLSQGKPSTVRAAESHLRRHLLPAFGRLRLDEVGPEAQQAFISRISTIVSRKTVLNIMVTLSAILNKAKEWKYLTETVNFQSLALPAGNGGAQARFFTVTQAQAIIATAEQPWKMVFALASMTGMRAGELLGLQNGDLDFQAGIIHVRRSAWYGKSQTPKTRTSARTIPMPEALARSLKEYLQHWRPNPAGYLFVTRNNRPPSSNNVVEHHLWPILNRLGIPRCGLHAFRHMHSSLLVETGAPVSVAQAQLGHVDPSVTLGIYSHVIGDSQRRAVEKVAEILDHSGLQTQGLSHLIQ
jgi:integrase